MIKTVYIRKKPIDHFAASKNSSEPMKLLATVRVSALLERARSVVAIRSMVTSDSPAY